MVISSSVVISSSSSVSSDTDSDSTSDSPYSYSTCSVFYYKSTLIGSTSPFTTASAYSDNFSFLSPKYSDNYLK